MLNYQRVELDFPPYGSTILEASASRIDQGHLHSRNILIASQGCRQEQIQGFQIPMHHLDQGPAGKL